MISGAIWNKGARVNFFKDQQNFMSPSGECNLWSQKKLTSAYLLQIVQEKSCDYVLVIYMKKLVIYMKKYDLNYAEAKCVHQVQK